MAEHLLLEHFDRKRSIVKAPARHLHSVPMTAAPKPSAWIIGERYLTQRDWEKLLLGSLILPVQYYDQIRRPRVLDGEHKLMFAVLEDAINEYLQSGDPRNFQELMQRRELEKWFAAEDQSGIFTFESLCETFGMDSRALWKSLQSGRRLQRQQERMATLSYRRPSPRHAI